jgi:integrase/recombinase XerC
MFASAVDAFKTHLRSRGASVHTVAAYTRDVVQLGEVLGAGGEDLDPAALDLARLRTWLRELYRRGVTPASRARKIAAVRAFCAHLARAGALSSNPALELALPRFVRPLPEVIPPEDAGELVELAPLHSVLALRDRAMLELLYGCGLRVSELVALDVDDVRGRVLRIAGQSSARAVPVGRPASRALRGYLKRRAELAGDTRALFVGRRGKRLGVRRLQTLVARRGEELGRAGLHPAVLRHSCGVHLLDGGADLFVVARVLGHASIATTARYEALAINRLAAVYRSAHPLSRRKPA